MFDPEAAGGADGEDKGSGGGGEALKDLVQIEVVGGGEVGFVEEDDGAGAALLRDDEVALDAALVEIAIEAADDEEDVDVDGEDLLSECGAGLFAGEKSLAFKDVLNDGRAGAEGDPVAYGGPEGGVMAEVSADEGFEFAGSCPDGEALAGCRGYARGCAGALLDGEKAIPAEVF